ncbi:hypothetical protein ACTVLL_24770 [Serratia nevei]|uniref:hypothetical protein n=1 Tax=Serratia nevei TaxID=2703794 RepID=UPI003FA79BB5
MTSKPSQKFATFWAVLAELENSGHPRGSLWIKAGFSDLGQWDFSEPLAFIAGDSRTLAIKGSDGAWHTLEGYNIPNAPGGSTPTVTRGNGVFYLPDCVPQLELLQPR